MKAGTSYEKNDFKHATPLGDSGRESKTAPLLCLLFIVYFVLNLRQLMDYDVWFQLLAGRYTIENWAIPRTEFYIYSGLGESAIFVAWLWGSTLYLSWQVFGYAGISVFNAVIWGLVFFVGARAAIEISKHETPGTVRVSPRLQIIAAFVASSIVYQYLALRANARAEVTLYLVWVIAMYFSAGIAYHNDKLRRFLVVTPFLALLLGWVHTTAIFIAVYLVCCLIHVAVYRWRAGGARGAHVFVREELWMWVLSIFFATTLPVLNPIGLQSALGLFTSSSDALLGIFSGKQSVPDVAHINLEYRRLLDVPERWSTAVLFLLASFYIVWQDRHRRIANLLLMLLGLLLSLLHVRGLAVWAILLLVPLAVCVARTFAKYESRIESSRRAALASLVIAACCFWSAGVVFNKQRTVWGVGYSHSSGTDEVLRKIRQEVPGGGNIFNWHASGAFLRWQLGDRYYVAMDGHLLDDKSSMSVAYYAIADFSEKTPALLERWAIRAVYHPTVNPLTGEIYALPHYLLNSVDWQVSAVSRDGVLFIKKTGIIDERNRQALTMEYWRSVAANARYVELVATQVEYRNQARISFEFALLNLKALQDLGGR